MISDAANTSTVTVSATYSTVDLCLRQDANRSSALAIATNGATIGTASDITEITAAATAARPVWKVLVVCACIISRVSAPGVN